MSRRDLLLAMFVAVVWGFSFIVAKWALVDVPPLLFGALRFGSVAALAPFLPRPKVGWRVLLAFGLAWGTVQFGGVFLALSFGLPAGLTAIVMQSQLVFTLVFAFGLKLEAPSPKHLWMIGLAAAGLAVIGTAHDQHVPLAGFIAAVCAAAGWAAGNVLARRLAEHDVRVDNAGFVARASIVPAASLFIASLIVEGPTGVTTLATHFGVRTAVALAYQSGLSLVAGGLIWNALLRRYSASTVAPFSLLVPIVGLCAGHLAFGESISARQGLGTCLLLAGLAVHLAFRRVSQHRATEGAQLLRV